MLRGYKLDSTDSEGWIMATLVQAVGWESPVTSSFVYGNKFLD